MIANISRVSLRVSMHLLSPSCPYLQSATQLLLSSPRPLQIFVYLAPLARCKPPLCPSRPLPYPSLSRIREEVLERFLSENLNWIFQIPMQTDLPGVNIPVALFASKTRPLHVKCIGAHTGHDCWNNRHHLIFSVREIFRYNFFCCA